MQIREFNHFYGSSDIKLKGLGVIRYFVDEKSGFPDSIEMQEGEVGEPMLLVNHLNQPAQTHYRA